MRLPCLQSDKPLGYSYFVRSGRYNGVAIGNASILFTTRPFYRGRSVVNLLRAEFALEVGSSVQFFRDEYQLEIRGELFVIGCQEFRDLDASQLALSSTI